MQEYNEMKELKNLFLKMIIYCGTIKHHLEFKEMHPDLVTDVINEENDILPAISRIISALEL